MKSTVSGPRGVQRGILQQSPGMSVGKASITVTRDSALGSVSALSCEAWRLVGFVEAAGDDQFEAKKDDGQTEDQREHFDSLAVAAYRALQFAQVADEAVTLGSEIVIEVDRAQ